MQGVEEWYIKNSSNNILCEFMEFIESQVEKYKKTTSSSKTTS
jgi:hypothetical protein